MDDHFRIKKKKNRLTSGYWELIQTDTANA